MSRKILLGVLGIIAGMFIGIYPVYGAILVPTLLVLFIGLLGLIISFVTIIQGIKGGGWGEGILGFLGILFGIALIANPLIGATNLPYVLGIFGVIGDIGAIIGSFLVRSK